MGEYTYETIGRGASHDFEHDPEQPAVLEIKARGAEFADAEALVAEKALALIAGGSSIAKAAEAVGLTPAGLKANHKARAALRRLRDQYELETDEIKQLVKARAVELALDDEDRKLALDAAKFLGQMPDVGLTSSYAKVSLAVGVFSDETSRVLASISSEDDNGR